jgi:hypothetical protein
MENLGSEESLIFIRPAEPSGADCCNGNSSILPRIAGISGNQHEQGCADNSGILLQIRTKRRHGNLRILRDAVLLPPYGGARSAVINRLKALAQYHKGFSIILLVSHLEPECLGLPNVE